MSNLDENLTTEYLYNTEPAVTVETEEKQSGKGMYTFLSVFFFILALAGLFIGMITAVWAKFQQAPLFIDFVSEDGSTSVFGQSMLGKFVALFGDLVNKRIILSGLPLSTLIWYFCNIFLVFAITLSAVLALTLMIIAIVTKSKNRAKNSAMTSGIVLFLVYGGYFLLSYAVSGMVDAPVAIISGLVLITLIVTAIVRSKVYGLLSSLLLALTIVAIMMLNYPTAELTHLSSLTAFDLYGTNMFLGVAMTFLVVVLGFNLVASTIRICPKRYYVFDAVRYGIQLLAVILTLVAFMVSKNIGTWDIFTTEGQTLATVLLLVCSIATFVVALLETLLGGKKKTAAQEIVVDDRQPTLYDQPAYMGYPQPVIQPIVVAQAPVQPVYPQPVVQPQPKPAETRVYVQQPERPDVPVTEFERKMQNLARGNSSVYDASPVPVSQQRVNAEAHSTYDKRRKNKNQPASGSSYVYEGSQYVYDPFIKTLNVQERNEFGDLFIANIYGLRSYLPTYVIGGDNKVFFDRVFIYLGCYRNYISQELLEKIYLYVSKQ